ncbi:MAG TPA: GNAT family N-acetyltransferase, partial [Pseudonocardiaceae bacterium]|nr:GNAT family N-acetyltransferase [Pseudonocardiaceae bacterium]
MITRVAERHWHALEDDRVIGRGQAVPRPDGRVFLSIDVWRAEDFDRLAEVMLADLPRPLYTVVDEADADLTCQWRRAGFTTRRREWEYVLPTDPAVTGLDTAPPPAEVTIVPTGAADEMSLRALDRLIRDEIG